MTSSERPKQIIGEIVWRDLTVDDASGVRDFYTDVVGWESVDHPMPAPAEGEETYNDFVMQTPPGPGEGDVVAGVCHARGMNEGVPPMWLMYVRVADMEASLEKAKLRGGEVVYGPRSMGNGRMAVVRDPAGAVLGLWAD
ncbi:MAG: putative enzyme related to lactoylglutathione lyase [Bacteroidia bacterium]|jgi:predicted enzyme related to lactoylglutathione lyase